MKWSKIIILCCVVFIISCQKDDIFIGPEEPIHQMIFETPTSIVSDGQEIWFNATTDVQHQLIITTTNGSVIAKEKFVPVSNPHNHRIYTKSIPKGEYQLILKKDNSEISKTRIIIE